LYVSCFRICGWPQPRNHFDSGSFSANGASAPQLRRLRRVAAHNFQGHGRNRHAVSFIAPFLFKCAIGRIRPLLAHLFAIPQAPPQCFRFTCHSPCSQQRRHCNSGVLFGHVASVLYASSRRKAVRLRIASASSTRSPNTGLSPRRRNVPRARTK
jgi:hypothetical protein